jgi:hypothetical protein
LPQPGINILIFLLIPNDSLYIIYIGYDNSYDFLRYIWY